MFDEDDAFTGVDVLGLLRIIPPFKLYSTSLKFWFISDFRGFYILGWASTDAGFWLCGAKDCAATL